MCFGRIHQGEINKNSESGIGPRLVLEKRIPLFRLYFALEILCILQNVSAKASNGTGSGDFTC